MAVVSPLIRNWWALGLRGLCAVLFGFGAFAWPRITLGILIVLFGLYALIDGIFAVVAGVRAAEHHERYASLLWRGLIGIAAGVVAFVAPAIIAVVLTFLIGAWAVVTGGFEIVAAVHLHRAHREWLLILNGALSVLFGMLLFAAPGLGMLTLVWLIAGYAVFFGIVMLALAFRLRGRQLRHAARA